MLQNKHTNNGQCGQRGNSSQMKVWVRAPSWGIYALSYMSHNFVIINLEKWYHRWKVFLFLVVLFITCKTFLVIHGGGILKLYWINITIKEHCPDLDHSFLFKFITQLYYYFPLHNIQHNWNALKTNVQILASINNTVTKEPDLKHNAHIYIHT